MRILLYIVLGFVSLIGIVLLGAWIYVTKIYSVTEASNLLVPTATFSQENVDIIYNLSNEFENETEIAFAYINAEAVSYYGISREQDSIVTISNKDRVFEIGSITKVMTAQVMAELVEKGDLDLEASILDYIPIKNERLRPIKLKHLPNHTSGLPRMPDNLKLKLNDPYKDYGKTELYEYLSDFDKDVEVGVVSDYSNLGFGIIGHIVELVSGDSLESLYQQYIFEPMLMSNSSSYREKVLNMARPGNGMLGAPGYYWNFDVLAAAGAVKSSVSQMTSYIRFLIEDNPVSSMMRMSTFVSEKENLGQALIIKKYGDGASIFWHNGATGGFRSCMAFEPKSKKGVVVLSNLNIAEKRKANIDQLCFKLLKSFLS